MTDGDLWRRDAVLAGIDLTGVDLVTMDVFDTLLMRFSGPSESVFARVAREARGRGLVEGWVTGDAFTLMRRDAEAQARRAAGGEVTLAGIYAQLRLDGADTAALAALEREAEARTTFANPYTLSFLRSLARQGVPVALLSDMHLPADAIDAMLETAGIRRGADYGELYVSCERGEAKAAGGLFRRLLADRPDLTAARVLHVGDDPASDQAGAHAAGVRAVLYAPPAHCAAIMAREQRLGIVAPGPLPALRTLAALGVTDRGEGADGFFAEFGALVLGPVAVHYAHWVLRDALARGIGTIAPLMREGCLLGTLMEREARRLGLEVAVRPLHVSRAALLLPQLTDFDAADLEGLATDNVHRTAGDLAAMLGVGPLPDDLAAAAAVPLIDLLASHRRDGGGAYARLRDWLLEPYRHAGLTERANAARAALLEYLRQELGYSARIALVDIGARGTLAARLSAIDTVRERYDPLGYLFYATPAALSRMAAGLPLRVCMPLTAEHIEQARIVYRSPQFLELLLNGEAQTTVGYRRAADGRVTPVTEPATLSDAQRAALRACRAGILHYADICARVGVGADAAPESERDVAPAALLGILHRAVHLPAPHEAERLGALVYDVNDGSRAARALCDAQARRVVAELCATVRPALWPSFALQTRPSDVPWPQGALALDHPGHLDDLMDGVRGGFGHRAVSRQLVDMAVTDGIGHLLVCAAGGTGGMGPVFIETAREAGLAIVGYADLLVPTPGGVFVGVPAMTIEEAARHDCRQVAVISVGYGATILEALRAGGRDDPRPLACVWFDGARFRRTVLANGSEPEGTHA
ncbi:HAD family hydrolase [Azospirillum sp. ST 5-10]|uniref:HAD family hydrolase n=1 Tax=unclassified Azospirillum TaxID=2630922 RepID=UPI003F4A6513